MYKIDSDLKEFVESGVAASVATGDAAGRPHARYAWAPRVHADGTTVDVFVDAVRAGETLANLTTNGKIALTMAQPVNYRSVQFKGTFIGSAEPDDADMAWVRQGLEAFSVSTALVGDPQEAIQNLWTDTMVRITFRVERAFDQTPGPEAGRPL
jgi:hypothetical protein